MSIKVSLHCRKLEYSLSALGYLHALVAPNRDGNRPSEFYQFQNGNSDFFVRVSNLDRQFINTTLRKTRKSYKTLTKPLKL